MDIQLDVFGSHVMYGVAGHVNRRDVVAYHLLDHETSDLLKKTQYLKVERWVSGQPAQSASV
jgi:hypothetical protein